MRLNTRNTHPTHPQSLFSKITTCIAGLFRTQHYEPLYPTIHPEPKKPIEIEQRDLSRCMFPSFGPTCTMKCEQGSVYHNPAKMKSESIQTSILRPNIPHIPLPKKPSDALTPIIRNPESRNPNECLVAKRYCNNTKNTNELQYHNPIKNKENDFDIINQLSNMQNKINSISKAINKHKKYN